tara:strand:+ start:424 stop:624 length:201 start_codon:yes stop_codon:yes gene_type:complete
MINKKLLLDLWFFGFCPLAVYFAPLSPVTPFLLALIVTLSLLWSVLRIADFIERPRPVGLIGEALQ